MHLHGVFRMADKFEMTDVKDFGYEIFIAFISILSVVNLVLVYLPGVGPAATDVVYTINIFLTIIFFFDFGFRLLTAQSRTYYFLRDWGWADLFACAPVFRFLRIFRIVKAYRFFHTYGTKKTMYYLRYHRAEAALYILIFSVILILEAGSFLVLQAESGAPDANILTSGDALWWAYVTITTVGYGDYHPVTDNGRIIGIIVMTTGVGIFATFAGYIAHKLLAPAERCREESEVSEIERKLDLCLAGLDELRKEQAETGIQTAEKIENLGHLIKQGP